MGFISPVWHTRLDKGWIGFLFGLIVPVITLMIYYRLNYSFMNPDNFIYFQFFRKVFAPLVSLCVVPNLGLFFVFYWQELNYAARGVIGSTLLYACFIFIFIFLLQNGIV